jgi:hypothetical protein
MRALNRLAFAISLTLTASSTAHAVVVLDTAAPFVVSAELKFDLLIGRFLYLQIGSVGTTVDTVVFDLTTLAPSNFTSGTASTLALGNGVPVSASAGGSVPVLVRSNSGSVTLSVSNNGGGLGLSNGANRYLSYNSILVQSTNASLPAPLLTNAGGNAVTINGVLYSGRVVDQSTVWTFQLANNIVPLPGTYSGQVTYTASSP